jgi:DNA-binding NtrC family response regulator
MATTPERRGPDRRRRPRGGRREEDREGFAPLVMLVGDEPGVMDRSEAILAKLRFAVATSSSVDHALRALPDLKPDLVVAGEWDGARIRSSAPDHMPIVVMSQGMQDDPEALIEEIRRTLRASA